MEYLTGHQVARLLHCSPYEIYKLIKLGIIPALKIDKQYRVPADCSVLQQVRSLG